MPCRSEEPWERENALNDNLNRERQTVARLGGELDNVTALLCATMRCLEKFGPNEVGSVLCTVPGLRDWWTKHQEFDRRRKAAEEAEAKRIKEEAEAEAKRIADEMIMLVGKANDAAARLKELHESGQDVSVIVAFVNGLDPEVRAYFQRIKAAQPATEEHPAT